MCARKLNRESAQQAIKNALTDPCKEWNPDKKGAHNARVNLADAILNLPEGSAILQKMKNVRFPDPDFLNRVLFLAGLECEDWQLGGVENRKIIFADLAKMISENPIVRKCCSPPNRS